MRSTSAPPRRTSPPADARSGSPTRTATASRASTSTSARSGRPSLSATARPGSPSPTASRGWRTAATARSPAIDENTNAVVQRIPVGTNPTGVAAGDGAVWVANTGEQTISRINPRSGRVTRLDVHAEPTELAVGAGCAVDDELRHPHRLADRPPIGARAGGRRGGRRPERHRRHRRCGLGRQQPRRHRLADRPGDGGRRRRRSLSATGRTRSPPGRAACGSQSSSATSSIASTPTATRSRSGSRSATTRRARARRRCVVGGDPGLGRRASRRDASRAGEAQRLRRARSRARLRPGSRPIAALTGDGLTAVQHAAGRDGTQIVPDLAVTLPTPQDGGRTYRFVLRPGIRYSTGGEVRARDVRPSFERIWKLRPFRRFSLARATTSSTPSSAPRGARANPGPATSRAASSPSRATIRWSRSTSRAPDPEFLYKLALNFGVHPARGNAAACRRPAAPCPRPARTCVARYDTGHEIVLTRNPRVPGVVAGGAARRLPRPDRSAPQHPTVPPKSMRSFAGRRTTRCSAGCIRPRAQELLTQHARPDPRRAEADNDRGSFLNTQSPRSTTCASAGPSTTDRSPRRRARRRRRRRATPTCQILPPNIPGYVRYCPYGAPDLRTARRLVAASGTRGMRVVVCAL